MNIALIDNYDSFTFNLVHLIGGFGPKVKVWRNDKVSAGEISAGSPDAIVISPGPGTPDQAGISCALVELAGPRIPVLGVCLGHQAIGQVYGGSIVRAAPVHGKTARIHHQRAALFEGISQDFEAARYHSLVIDRAACPPCLEITAETGDGLVMAVSHRDYPVYGVQFHPESIATQAGGALVANFLKLAKAWNARYRNSHASLN